MKAWRNINGNVVEIDVDLDLRGNPILPPDTTINVRPEPQEGHYVTVVGREWVQIPITVPFVSFETKVQKAVSDLQVYRDWYLNQPVDHAGTSFDADETARNRLVQALVIYQSYSYLPPAWITFNNEPFPINAIEDLTGIIDAVQTAFSTRFFEMDALRRQILAAETEEALAAITIPTISNTSI